MIGEYDTQEGIERFLHSFEGLQELRLQRKAAFERRERLSPWLVMRHFFLDNQGGCWELSQKDRYIKEEIAKLPTVSSVFPETLTYSMASLIPRHVVTCACCNKPIALNEYPEVVKQEASGHVILDMTPYAGMSLKSVESVIAMRTDGRYSVWEKTPVRNQKEGENEINEWRLERNDYIIQAGDECQFPCFRYYHRECFTRLKSESSLKEFTEIFTQAGFQNIQMTEIPNRYCPCDYCEPWQEVTTQIGKFVIGWRKRVISIDWGKPDYAHLFEKENVTKWETGIHAWGDQKAIEYLKAIRELSANETEEKSCSNCAHFWYESPNHYDQPYPEFACSKGHWDGVASKEEMDALDKPNNCDDWRKKNR